MSPFDDADVAFTRPPLQLKKSLKLPSKVVAEVGDEDAQMFSAAMRVREEDEIISKSLTMDMIGYQKDKRMHDDDDKCTRNGHAEKKDTGSKNRRPIVPTFSIGTKCRTAYGRGTISALDETTCTVEYSWGAKGYSPRSSLGLIRDVMIMEDVREEELQKIVYETILEFQNDLSKYESRKNQEGRFLYHNMFLVTVMERIVPLARSQREVSDCVGINSASMSLWINGKSSRNFTPSLEVKIAKWISYFDIHGVGKRFIDIYGGMDGSDDDEPANKRTSNRLVDMRAVKSDLHDDHDSKPITAAKAKKPTAPTGSKFGKQTPEEDLIREIMKKSMKDEGIPQNVVAKGFHKYGEDITQGTVSSWFLYKVKEPHFSRLRRASLLWLGERCDKMSSEHREQYQGLVDWSDRRLETMASEDVNGGSSSMNTGFRAPKRPLTVVTEEPQEALQLSSKDQMRDTEISDAGSIDTGSPEAEPDEDDETAEENLCAYCKRSSRTFNSTKGYHMHVAWCTRKSAEGADGIPPLGEVTQRLHSMSSDSEGVLPPGKRSRFTPASADASADDEGEDETKMNGQHASPRTLPPSMPPSTSTPTKSEPGGFSSSSDQQASAVACSATSSTSISAATSRSGSFDETEMKSVLEEKTAMHVDAGSSTTLDKTTLSVKGNDDKKTDNMEDFEVHQHFVAEGFAEGFNYYNCDVCKTRALDTDTAFQRCVCCPCVYHLGCLQTSELSVDANWVCGKCKEVKAEESRWASFRTMESEGLLNAWIMLYSHKIRRWRLAYVLHSNLASNRLIVKWWRIDNRGGKASSVDISDSFCKIKLVDAPPGVDMRKLNDLKARSTSAVSTQKPPTPRPSTPKPPKSPKDEKKDGFTSATKVVKKEKAEPVGKEPKNAKKGSKRPRSVTFPMDGMDGAKVMHPSALIDSGAGLGDRAQGDANGDMNKPPADGMTDTYISKNTLQAALCTAGSACRAVDIAMCNENTNVFACTRPPGHHAGRYGTTAGCTSTGFCLFNNAALALVYARVRWGLERVAVVDIDVHFGNGTAELLRDDPNAFFASVHMIYGDNNLGLPADIISEDKKGPVKDPIGEPAPQDILDQKPADIKTSGFYPSHLGATEVTDNYVSVGVFPPPLSATGKKLRMKGITSAVMSRSKDADADADEKEEREDDAEVALSEVSSAADGDTPWHPGAGTGTAMDVGTEAGIGEDVCDTMPNTSSSSNVTGLTSQCEKKISNPDSKIHTEAAATAATADNSRDEMEAEGKRLDPESARRQAEIAEKLRKLKALKGAEAYRYALSHLIIPQLERFAPQLLIISAGFDGYVSDPLGGELHLSLDDYAWSTKQVMMGTDVNSHGTCIQYTYKHACACTCPKFVCIVRALCMYIYIQI
jgi:acetoin utilization deacetylase AcuC-like enzyme